MKAAVIGLGPHGHRVIDVIKQMPALTLAAVVDRRPYALKSEAIPEETACYQTAEELWATDDIDLVCITTNCPSHAELAIAGMDAGIQHVMVEKPMACSLLECEAIMAKADETGARLVVERPRRYTLLYRWMRNEIASGH